MSLRGQWIKLLSSTDIDQCFSDVWYMYMFCSFWNWPTSFKSYLAIQGTWSGPMSLKILWGHYPNLIKCLFTLIAFLMTRSQVWTWHNSFVVTRRRHLKNCSLISWSFFTQDQNVSIWSWSISSWNNVECALVLSSTFSHTVKPLM